MHLRTISRALLALTLISLFCAASPAQAQAPLGEGDGFFAALHDGEGSVAFRYRFEYVDQDGKSEQALASTLRTAMRYQTMQYRGLDLFLEATNVADMGSGPYSLPGDPAVNYPVVADPLLSMMNQAFLRWTGSNGAIKGGRQELVYDNARFVGNVGWRQNHQNFDSVRADWTLIEKLGLRYTYIGQVHTITDVELDLYGHIVNASYDLNRFGKLRGYALMLDFDVAKAANSNTFGGSWVGNLPLGEGPWNLKWRGEYAVQQDAYDNPGSIDATYMHLMGGFGQEKIGIGVGFEQLSGSMEDGQFNTAFATAHKFNGWADKFLKTPTGGLNDFYVSAGGKASSFGYVATWHKFDAESTDAVYGTEIDALVTYKTSWKQLLAVKGAIYSADGDAPVGTGQASDVTKVWFYTTFTF